VLDFFEISCLAVCFAMPIFSVIKFVQKRLDFYLQDSFEIEKFFLNIHAEL